MAFYDNEVLIRNISELMKNNDMTQVQLADILGMSQSNVSKALSLRDKKSFTLDQVAGIAQHFNVSVDFLLGLQNTTLNPNNQEDIARFVAALLTNQIAKYKQISVEEEVFVGSYDSEIGHYLYEPERKVNDYLAVYFPNYYELPSPKDQFDDDAWAELDYARCSGNETRNYRLNEFLGQLIKLLDFYKSDTLDRETFDKVVDSCVEKITGD
ncbi:MAG: helix-turn-helix transcriptional regulator [Lachnospiraceae bacterium]|nr:helix-turn-helix transcriptional regulator [Lachnospiraceae bacterium]